MGDINTKDNGIFNDFTLENYHHFKDDDNIVFDMDDIIRYPIICCDCGLVHYFRFKERKNNTVIFYIDRAEKPTEIVRKKPPFPMEMLTRIKKLEDENKALRKFILRMASQIGIIVKKL